MVEGYLQDRPQLRLALLLIDCRIPPTPDDILMKEWLDHYQIQNTVILTKSDKLSRNRLIQSVVKSRENARSRSADSILGSHTSRKEGNLEQRIGTAVS